MFLFITVVQALIAAALVGVVLMQRSEGGGLGIGGSPSGALGARGAADFMTRATKWLAIAFVALSIVLAGLAVRETGTSTISTTLDRSVPASGAGADPLADPLAAPGAAPAAAPEQAPTQDPLAE
ncbi:MAG: preprotein translocase subunit SecG [Erythrobacter sp.]